MNTTASAAPSTSSKTSSFKLWLDRENKFHSSLLEEKVTNNRVLRAYHCMVSGFALCILAGNSLLLGVLALVWFAVSLIQVKKGGCDE
ncbi:MAG: hypothetical protein RR206_04785 [Bacteroidaceae bacterium]